MQPIGERVCCPSQLQFWPPALPAPLCLSARPSPSWSSSRSLSAPSPSAAAFPAVTPAFPTCQGQIPCLGCKPASQHQVRQRCSPQHAPRRRTLAGGDDGAGGWPSLGCGSAVCATATSCSHEGGAAAAPPTACPTLASREASNAAVARGQHASGGAQRSSCRPAQGLSRAKRCATCCPEGQRRQLLRPRAAPLMCVGGARRRRGGWKAQRGGGSHQQRTSILRCTGDFTSRRSPSRQRQA